MTALKATLLIAGSIIVWLGLNVGLGGIATLGWQGATNFVAATDARVYAVQDNHVRFIAGVWTAVGLLMIAGAIAFQQLRGVLVALTAMVFVGGLMRLSAGDFALLASAKIAPSLFAELVLFPALGLWIAGAGGDKKKGRPNRTPPLHSSTEA
ncbi:hypothetical protein AIOL_000610 [Candidatus Rhodobacter oscarellae]|uniref:DUF4345 domain-containing protein n=1 Tax=Candidatus Rhodobacter oscarellae TaxID=1675527 RepID=A0A0J9EFJ8_9RHOB|nr:DUF4345 domain-containing protein [Candidatus Rhodobacter lobularis]KMW60454.1 hypothetical protein AIOL_000610 [Candidatus Rhodobacter lobularis]